MTYVLTIFCHDKNVFIFLLILIYQSKIMIVLDYLKNGQHHYVVVHRDKLNKEIEKLQADVRTAKASANEEKSLKLFQERKVKELESQLREADAETDQHVVRLNEQLKEVETVKLELQQQVCGCGWKD